MRASRRGRAGTSGIPAPSGSSSRPEQREIGDGRAVLDGPADGSADTQDQHAPCVGSWGSDTYLASGSLTWRWPHRQPRPLQPGGGGGSPGRCQPTQAMLHSSGCPRILHTTGRRYRRSWILCPIRAPSGRGLIGLTMAGIARAQNILTRPASLGLVLTPRVGQGNDMAPAWAADLP